MFLRTAARIINDRKLQMERCKQNKAERFLHSSSAGPQCPCFWLSLQSQMCAACPCATRPLPASPGSLLWLSTPVPRHLQHSLSLQAGSFCSHFSPSSRKTIQPLLLRGLQHEFKQMRQLWSHLASPLVSFNLDSPCQTYRRKAPGCREGLGGEGLLKLSH